ncbi:hypothetical protein vseg_009868 [Gypsophila vaccaria]
MDRGKQLQSAGICHKLFCFIMKFLASQAKKPVTLGPPVIQQQSRSTIGCRLDQASKFQTQAKDNGIGSIIGTEDFGNLISIEIEDETCALLDSNRGGYGTGENGTKIKTARKMVSIKDEPEIIGYPSKKRRKNERQILGLEGDVRPLKSILKVGSKMHETSLQKVSPKPYNSTLMYY